MIPRKTDPLAFDASSTLNMLSRPFHHRINLAHEPEMIIGGENQITLRHFSMYASAF
jgi:hypothetical protein